MNYAKLIRYAKLCDAAYLSSDISDENAGSSAIIRNYKSYIIVAFRGSELTDVNDILADINFFPKINTYGICHRGFYNAFKSLRSELTKLIIENPGKKIIFTGHSLGGSMATLAPIFLDCKNCEVYTFGAPPSMKLLRNYPVPLYNIINDEDSIANISFIYKHYGVEFKLSGMAMEYESLLKYKGFSIEGILDHKLENYIKALEILYDISYK